MSEASKGSSPHRHNTPRHARQPGQTRLEQACSSKERQHHRKYRSARLQPAVPAVLFQYRTAAMRAALIT